MSPIDWATLPLKKYADFSGRAPRAEYWWYVLFLIIVMVIAMIIEGIVGLKPYFANYGLLTMLVMLGTFIPSLAAQVRRLHDTDRSGWWVAAMWVPYAIGLWSMRSVFAATAALDPNNPDPEAINQIAAQSTGSVGMGGLFMLVAVIFGIIILVFLCLKGTDGENKYGPDPYGA